MERSLGTGRKGFCCELWHRPGVRLAWCGAAVVAREETAASQPGNPRKTDGCWLSPADGPQKTMVRHTGWARFFIAIFVRDASLRAAARNINTIEKNGGQAEDKSHKKDTD